jgi:GDP-D-mannose 3', 5'-epimerase
VRRLKAEGYWVRGVDLKPQEFGQTAADEFILGDLREPAIVRSAVCDVQEIYQLAGDMGGAGYIFTGEHDADILYNSSMVNLNTLQIGSRAGVARFFFTSSACIYPQHNQLDPDYPDCAEASAYPACPDSDYGWEKLFGERLYLAFARNRGIQVRIARLHNIFGPFGAWTGGREKAPAAICRKIAEAQDDAEIEIWGDGRQTRSFLYVDECLEGIIRLMGSDFSGPCNIGSEEMISIDAMARLVMDISGKQLRIRHVAGPIGVRGRNSDNRLIRERLGWEPSRPLREGLEKTYHWIAAQVHRSGAWDAPKEGLALEPPHRRSPMSDPPVQSGLA